MGDTIAKKGKSASIYVKPGDTFTVILPPNKVPQNQPTTAPSIVPTQSYFEGLGTIKEWFFQEGSTTKAYGAVVLELKENFVPPAGWVIHTVRVTGGNVGDTKAYKGEGVSIYVKPGDTFTVK